MGRDAGAHAQQYCIVTGANSGIGREIAAGLMAKGHHVVLACRNMDACEAVARDLAAAHPQGACECSRVDLEDHESVRQFASRHRAALRKGGRRLGVLVNNAGIMGPPNYPDGRDRHLWANHLGPYLLTRLLLPSLADGGRVVNVASRAHYWGDVKLRWRRQDGGGGGGGSAATAAGGGVAIGGGGGGADAGEGWEFESHPANWFRQYARSKLLNVLFTHELQRRHGPASSSSSGGGAARAVVAAAVSPGMVGTSIFDRLPWPLSLAGGPMRLLARSPAKGAETAVWAAAAEEVDGSPKDVFLHDCKPLRPSALALNADLAAAAWDASARLVGLHPDRDE